MAAIVPFELFLFSYAIFGPLHYLTEISWLHDKQYFTKRKYDYVVLILIALLLSLIFLNNVYKIVEIDAPITITSTLTWIALMLAILFVMVKNTAYRILGMIAIVATVKISKTDTAVVYMAIFLPTLIHVYVFTGLFMLYGALKSKSRMGLMAVLAFILCPILLMNVFPNQTFFQITDYGKAAYVGKRDIGFTSVNMEMLRRFFEFTVQGASLAEVKSKWLNAVFYSPQGIAIARLIAFAYTYHYLNWFSKTKVIQWHKVPKVRFVTVIAIWLLSVSLYIFDYTLGLIWLFFLSLMHVLLELPLNAVSMVGIYTSLKGRISRNNPEMKVAKNQ